MCKQNLAYQFILQYSACMSKRELFDRIEREISIQATQSRVWELVSEPGWWINDGAVTAHRMESLRGDHMLVHDPDHGAFAVQRVNEQPQTYVAFRWYSGPSEDRRRGRLDPKSSTLVEFFISEEKEGATRLRVVESGFADLDEDQRRRRMMFEENSAGWQIELAAARTHLEPAQ